MVKNAARYCLATTVVGIRITKGKEILEGVDSDLIPLSLVKRKGKQNLGGKQ